MNSGFVHNPFTHCLRRIDIAGTTCYLRASVTVGALLLAFDTVNASTDGTGVYSQAPGAMYFLKLSLVLVFVIGIFLLFAKILRQVNGPGQSSRGPLKVIAGMSLSNRERLVIVKAGNTQLLLGISNSGMEKLHQFDEDIELLTGSDNESTGSFKGRFEQILSGLQK